MKLFGLIGYPLGHSFSKKYFTEKFEKEKLEDIFFELFPIQDITEFARIINSNPSLSGLAVTIPYKQSVIPFLHSVSEEALKIGAVNCIKVLPKELVGYNTDVLGFELSLAPLLQPHHHKALVLGTGGASRAVQYVLRKLQIPFLLVSRQPAASKDTISYLDIDQGIMDEYTVIINTSPVGMAPDVLAKPALPYELITPGHFLYDLVYEPAETRFLSEGRAKGAIVKNGYEMLVLQAEENWRIWNS